MKFLLCGVLSYYGRKNSRDPMYYYFHDTLTEMGHSVDCVDTYHYSFGNKPRDPFNATILEKVKKADYNAVIVATATHEFYPETLDRMREYTTLIAWNSDDDWRWDHFTKHLATHFDLMYTTYKDIYDQNKSNYPSLRLSQWACLERYDNYATKKDLDFTFVGKAYGLRLKVLYELRKKVGLRLFGDGTRPIIGNYQIDIILKTSNKILRKAVSIEFLKRDYLGFDQVNEIWGRSKVSLNLMQASAGNKLQIKSRTFDMGLSGTVMMCEQAPYIELYYEPEIEFIPFTNLEDLIDKYKYYISHPSKLSQIAAAYYRRTKQNHLWRHRIQQIIKDADLEK